MKKNSYSPLTKMKYEIVGVAIDIFDKLGPDHQEELYDDDFLVALEVAGFEVTDKPEIEILNARNEHLKFYYPDLRVQKD
ncbi:MAG: GxxExxY protein, partial [Methanosarcinaceae archaeon]